MYFFKESDLKCALVYELFSTQQGQSLLSNKFRLYEDVGDNKAYEDLKDKDLKSKSVTSTCVLTELKYGKRVKIEKEYKSKKNFIDIVIIHPDSVSFGIKCTVA